MEMNKHLMVIETMLEGNEEGDETIEYFKNLIKENEEKLFFPLDTVREKGYIYSISKERLQWESGLHKQITSQIKEKLSDEKMSVSFGVFPSDYKSDYGYVLAYSPNIQS